MISSTRYRRTAFPFPYFIIFIQHLKIESSVLLATMSHRYIISSFAAFVMKATEYRRKIKLALKLLQIDFLISEEAEINQTVINTTSELNLRCFSRALFRRASFSMTKLFLSLILKLRSQQGHQG